MTYFLVWFVGGAIIGSFGTAYIHEITGRDIRMGGIMGAVVGAIFSLPFLALFWLWLYYDRYTWRPVGRAYGKARRPWYRWWDF